MMNDDLLTIRDVAAILHKSPRTIYRYVRDGRLKAVRITPHDTRVPRSALAHFLSTQQATIQTRGQ